MGNKSSRRQQQQAAGSSYPSNTDQYISNRDHYSNHHNASAPAITNPSHYHIQESDVESIPVAYPVTSGPEIQAMPLNEMNRSNNNRVDSSWNDVARMIQSSNAEHNQRQQDSKHIVRR